MAHPKTIQIISLEEFTKNSLEEAFEFTDMDETCRDCPYSSFDDRNIHSASEEPNDAPECSGNASECLLLAETEYRAEEEYDNMIFKLEFKEVV